jgi:hypothetical protein
MTRSASRPTARARTLAAQGPVVVSPQPPATGHQPFLAGIIPPVRDAYARLHKSMGPRLAPALEAAVNDFVALGQPLRNAEELAAAEWRDALAARLRRYLTGSGPRAGRVIP